MVYGDPLVLVHEKREKLLSSSMVPLGLLVSPIPYLEGTFIPVISPAARYIVICPQAANETVVEASTFDLPARKPGLCPSASGFLEHPL